MQSTSSKTPRRAARWRLAAGARTTDGDGNHDSGPFRLRREVRRGRTSAITGDANSEATGKTSYAVSEGSRGPIAQDRRPEKL